MLIDCTELCGRARRGRPPTSGPLLTSPGAPSLTLTGQAGKGMEGGEGEGREQGVERGKARVFHIGRSIDYVEKMREPRRIDGALSSTH